MRHTGIVAAGIKAARNEPKKMKITTMTNTTASAIVVQTPAIAFSMNTVLSKAITMVTPSGRVFLISAASLRTARATSNALAFDWRAIPNPIWLTPLPRNKRRSSSAPTSTRATSSRRVSLASPARPTGNRPNSSAVR